jgi:hypothetical protein
MTYSEIYKTIIMSTKNNLMIITNSVKQREAQILQTSHA